MNFTQFQDANWVSTFPLYFLTEMQAASWVRTAAAATRAPPPASSAGLDYWGMLKGETQCCTELHRINSIATIDLVPQEMATSQAERWLRKSVTSLRRRVTLSTEGTLLCHPGVWGAWVPTGLVVHKEPVWLLSLLLPFLLFSALMLPYLSRQNNLKALFPGLDVGCLKNKTGPLFLCRLNFYKPLILVQ